MCLSTLIFQLMAGSTTWPREGHQHIRKLKRYMEGVAGSLPKHYADMMEHGVD